MIYINLLIIILLIIFIHELGHYSIARLTGVKVTDFSIGFGRPLYTFKDKYNTNWKFSLILLGGYVKIKGIESIFQKDSIKENDTDSFQSLNLFKKISILLAGSTFNILSAWICLFFISFFIGTIAFAPEFVPKVGNIVENSAAEHNDIRKGDIIIKVNDNRIKKFSDIGKYINNENYISMELIRDSEILHKEFELIYNNNIKRYFVGISPDFNETIINPFNAKKSLINSVQGVIYFYKLNFILLTESINKNTLSNDLTGPIGIIKNADQLMLDSLQGVLYIFIFFSLTISIINLFPIPLLDGGHIIYFTLRSIFSDTLPHIVTRIYIAIGITIISFLFIIITFNDIFYK